MAQAKPKPKTSAKTKTQPTAVSVDAFLARVQDETLREDCRVVIKIMKRITKAPPRMWGASIVGFGTTRLVYPNGREADWPIAAFAPRGREITVYGMGAMLPRTALMTKLGRHRTGKGCLYLKGLADVDLAVLEQLIEGSVKHTKQTRG